MTSSSSHEPGQESPFIKEVEWRHKRYRKLVQITNSTTRAAILMLLAAVTSIIIANTDAYFPFLEFWETEVGFVIGSFEVKMTLSHIVNDILMTLFFLLIGLDIKYEMTVGELTNIRQAILPIVAAAGGVIVPIVIYLIFNASNPAASHGWGVPTATDIAFALGIMSLLGNRVPVGIKVFLTTLAVADDIIAILIIAVFYGHSPDLFWMAGVVVVMIVLIIMNRTHTYSLVPYVLVGIVLWLCVYMSGIHSTIAGVLLAFTIPAGSKVNLKSFTSWSGQRVKQAEEQFSPDSHVMEQEDYLKTVAGLSKVAKEVVPPSMRLEKMLFPVAYFVVLPLFALTNADVRLVGGDMSEMLTNTALYGVFFGLLLGKPIGVVLTSLVVVKLKISPLPKGATWAHMMGAGILAGVGFTMAIFVANLAFTDDGVTTAAKLGILTASALAGVLGYLFLLVQARRDRRKEIEAEAGLLETTIEEDLCDNVSEQYE